MKGGDTYGEEAIGQEAPEANVLISRAAPWPPVIGAGKAKNERQPGLVNLGCVNKGNVIVFDDICSSDTMMQGTNELINMYKWYQDKINQTFGLPKEMLVDSRVEVSGADVRTVARALHSNDRHPYLTIEPQDDVNYNDDLPRYVPGIRARPTECFLITWRSGDESFQRIVNSVKELNAVLKPIFAEHVKAKRARALAKAKRLSEFQKREINSHKQEVARAREILAKAEEGLEKAIAGS